MSEGSSERLRVVTIGGGTGSSVLLTGLNEHADRLHISAIVTTFDDGGSSGKLRKRFGVPALGDIRRCIAALIPEGPNRQKLRDEFEFRFEQANKPQGRCLRKPAPAPRDPEARQLTRSHQRTNIHRCA